MMTLKLEGQTGMDIKEAFTESVRIAKLLNCYVDFDFNDVKCSAAPTGNPDRGVENYHSVLKDKKYPFANAF